MNKTAIVKQTLLISLELEPESLKNSPMLIHLPQQER